MIKTPHIFSEKPSARVSSHNPSRTQPAEFPQPIAALQSSTRARSSPTMFLPSSPPTQYLPSLHKLLLYYPTNPALIPEFSFFHPVTFSLS